MLPSHHRVVPRQHKHEHEQPNGVPGPCIVMGPPAEARQPTPLSL